MPGTVGVAAITNVDLDHMDRLGPTIRHIAREKAAIINRGDLAVTGATGEALAIIRRRARRLAVPLVEVAPAAVLGWTRDAIRVDLPALGAVEVGLRGRHQAANVAVADAILDDLATAGIATVDADARRSGYRNARWPGRLELLEVDGPGGPREVLLDGAHNPAGAATLAQALDDLRPLLGGGHATRAASRPPLTLLMAIMADKDADGVMDALDRSAALQDARIVCTQPEGSRPMPASELAARWRRRDPGRSIAAIANVREALDTVLRDAPGPIVVAGSLYLVGAVRAQLVDDPDLRDPIAPGER